MALSLTPPVTSRVEHRLASLDALRGAAIVLMVVDHAAAVFLAVAVRTAPDLYVLTADELGFLRHTLTRLALPGFMVVSGYLLQGRPGPSGRRVAQLVASAVVALLVARGIPGMPDVDVLVSYLLALTVWPYAQRSPALVAASCFAIAGSVSAFPHGLSGYHPGLVLGYLCVGALAARTGDTTLHRVGAACGTPLARVGRHPLAIYVGHLVVLRLAVSVMA